MDRLLIFLLVLFVGSSCARSEDGVESDGIWSSFQQMQETQLTSEKKGHFLHTTQFFSANDQWIVYDTRNDGTHISRTCCIEIVNNFTQEVKTLYQIQNQTQFGPGVGAATFSPVEDKVLFIHGLMNCDSTRPYSFSRRTGVAVEMKNPDNPIFMDARDVIPPFTPGALRGGTHAHTWSKDGEWVSFTYNDAIIAQLGEDSALNRKDLRMVGVMAPQGPVLLDQKEDGENFNGKKFSVITTQVTEDPLPGSDQIDRAYEDGWIGTDGYIKNDGAKQKRAVAFLGDTRDLQGNKLTEVFIVDIPEDVTKGSAQHPISGTTTKRPYPPKGVKQRRLTFTAKRKHPGVKGPRHWLRSTPDGSLIFFLMKDDVGLIQIYGVSPNGGPIQPITNNNFSVETTFNVSPDSKYIAFGSQQQVYVTYLNSGETKKVSPQSKGGTYGLRAINWSNDGKMLAYNRKVPVGDTSYFQIFLLKNKK